jgi:Ca-activated chloride channel homolog
MYKKTIRRLFFAILFFLCTPLFCFAISKAKKEVKEGNQLYHEGKFEEALKKYQKANTALPESSIANFDLGTAFYKTQKYNNAIIQNPQNNQKVLQSLKNKRGCS